MSIHTMIGFPAQAFHTSVEAIRTAARARGQPLSVVAFSGQEESFLPDADMVLSTDWQQHDHWLAQVQKLHGQGGQVLLALPETAVNLQGGLIEPAGTHLAFTSHSLCVASEWLRTWLLADEREPLNPAESLHSRQLDEAGILIVVGPGERLTRQQELSCIAMAAARFPDKAILPLTPGSDRGGRSWLTMVTMSGLGLNLAARPVKRGSRL